MSKAQELSQLHDIHLPQPIGWWPLAPGWYLLAILLCLFFGISIFFCLRWQVNNKAKRQALRVLTAYQQQHEQAGNTQLTCARLSELLKRVALVYFPREKVAGLRGQAWVGFLNSTAKGVDFNKVTYELLELPYRREANNTDLSSFFYMVETWIRQRKKPC